MTTEEFVSSVRKDVIERNLDIYANLFAVPAEQIQDVLWARFSRMYMLMNDEQRIILRQFARQVMVDTISKIFGVLDGSSTLGGRHEEFSLTCEAASDRLNGDLQDFFLAAEEEDEIGRHS